MPHRPASTRPAARRVALLLAAAAALAGCRPESPRKIKLAGVSGEGGQVGTVASVLDVAPRDQHRVGILEFENRTQDSSLDWLGRGLPDMLATEMSQSPHLLVVTPARIADLLAQAGLDAGDLGQPEAARLLASEGQVESLLAGRLYREGADLVIEAELRALSSGRVTARERVRGPGLERIFAMESELARKLRDGLSAPTSDVARSDLQVSEMTESVEAFRHYSLGLEAMDKFLSAEALRELDLAIAADPTFAPAHLHRFSAVASAGDMGGAVFALEQARKYAHKLTESQESLLRLREAQVNGDGAELQAAADELWSRAAHDVDARLEVAHLFFGLGDLDKAIEEYERILEEDPTRKIVYNMLGYIHAERGDFTSALRNLERYRDLTPGEPNAHDSIGETLVLAGRLKEAAGHFQRALERWPQFVNSLERLTQVYSELGEVDRALEYAQGWARSAPTARSRARALLTQALVHWRRGDHPRAFAAIEEARAADPVWVSPVVVTFLIHRAQGDEEAASRLAREYFAAHRDLAPWLGRDPDQLGQFLAFGLRAGLPPAELIPLIDRGAAGSRVASLRDMTDLYRGVALLRAGDATAAQELLWGQDGRLIQRLLGRRYVSRPGVWKHLIEAVERSPASSTAAIVAGATAAAERAGRGDLGVLARLLALQAEAKSGGSRDLRRAYRELGLPLEEDWRLAGPFDNRSGFERPFPPEPGAAPGEAADVGSGPAAAGVSSGGDGVRDGYVDLARIYGASDWKVAYAATRLVSPDRRVVQLRVGSDESCKLWLNGELVWQAYRKGDVGLDHDIVKVVLRPGENDLRIKVVNSLDEWGFYLRVTDEEGRGDEAVSFRPPSREQATAPPAATAQPRRG